MIIKQIKAEDTYPLRLSVLKIGEEYIYQYQGDFDKTTLHFGTFIDSKLVGIVSLMQHKSPLFKGKQLQLRGMAVATNEHGKSIGTKLVAHSKMICKQQKTAILWCNAREKVVGFYKKQGLDIIGEPFNIKHVGMHFTMFSNLD
jgi:GNAT superfamily N-acetyltransferase